jgi:hypothetical protein
MFFHFQIDLCIHIIAKKTAFKILIFFRDINLGKLDYVSDHCATGRNIVISLAMRGLWFLLCYHIYHWLLIVCKCISIFKELRTFNNNCNNVKLYVTQKRVFVMRNTDI